MDELRLYEQIAAAVREEILSGQLKPGNRLPSVREMCRQWNCTPGTVQRAYQELAREGLILSQPGKGTQVAGMIPQARIQHQGTLRTASLVHRSEAFLLEAITAGYNLEEIQAALDLAADRWRTLDQSPRPAIQQRLRFNGSHDLAVGGLAHHFFSEILPEVSLLLTFSGSLGGLIALRDGKAELAGAHLWDAATDTYNIPYISQHLPGKKVILVTLAHRRQGLITAPGNPLGIQSLSDLARPEVRFVNRQPGSGTRVWLDAMLEKWHISPRQVTGYTDERPTHSAVARAVAEGEADAGVGLETAALAFGLNYIHLNRERYDLIMLAETAENPALKALIEWLGSAEGKAFIGRYKGYESEDTGKVELALNQ